MQSERTAPRAVAPAHPATAPARGGPSDKLEALGLLLAGLSKAPGLMMSVSVYRTRAQGPYQADEIETINRVVAYLRAASTVCDGAGG